MIKLNHLNAKEFYLNSDLIQTVESTPDTLITLTNGAKIMVKESVQEVVDSFKEYKKSLYEFIKQI